MAFKLIQRSETATWFEAGERLWLTQDGRVVADGDPAAAFLFAVEGSRVQAEDVRRYGLLDDAKGDPLNPDADLKAGEWVDLVEKATGRDELAAILGRYAASGSDFKTVGKAVEKRQAELASGQAKEA